MTTVTECEPVFDYDDAEIPSCKHCGWDMSWAECHMIDCEDGEYDAHEQDCINNDPGTFVTCHECGGKGGHFYCPNESCSPPTGAPHAD